MAAKYVQTARELGKELRLMRQSGESKLPGEAALCQKYDCSRQTIRAALAVLQKQGLIVTRRGSGSYIADGPVSRGRQFAALLPDPSEYIYPGIVRDLRDALSPAGYTLRCYATDNQPTRERRVLSALLKDPPAGLFWEAAANALPCMHKDLLFSIQEAAIPLVYLHCAHPLPAGAVCVGQDDYGGAYSLVARLAKKGHRKVACIMRSDDARGLERYRGYMQACFDFNLHFQERHCLWFTAQDRKHLLDGGRLLFQSFLEAYLGPCTAVVCFNDEIAYHLLFALAAKGIKTPEDVAVVSFDNSHYTTAGDLGITSLGHEPHCLGAAAAKSMFALLEGKEPRSIALDWRLAERGSG